MVPVGLLDRVWWKELLTFLAGIASLCQPNINMSTTLRRRLHHGDIDGRRNEHYDESGLDEPLLEPYERQIEPKGMFAGDVWNVDRTLEQIHIHWTFLFTNVIAQWAQWLANIVVGSRSFIERFLPAASIPPGASTTLRLPYLSALQEERLVNLQRRLGVPFDGSLLEHQDALKKLWRLAYPDRQLPALKSELWKEMGWQGCDPSTDFRGGGYISLENLIYFATTYPNSFQRLLHKKDGKRAEWEYPFAVAGIHISFTLAQMLDLQKGKPKTQAGIRFMEMLERDEMAFDNLYCVAFQMMDAQWLAKRASYMEFNDVMKSTRNQLERELVLEDIRSVKDLPAYNLLSG
ncbi:ELMO domain-containing protein A [Linum grandiflorum]